MSGASLGGCCDLGGIAAANPSRSGGRSVFTCMPGGLVFGGGRGGRVLFGPSAGCEPAPISARGGGAEGARAGGFDGGRTPGVGVPCIVTPICGGIRWRFFGRGRGGGGRFPL